MIGLITSIFGGLTTLGSQWLENKKEKAQAKHEREITEIKEVASWDQIQAANSNGSWKDEYLTIILTAPFVVTFGAAAFGREDIVANMEYAFKVVSERIPDEYWLLLSVVVAASFGVKKIVDLVGAYRSK